MIKRFVAVAVEDALKDTPVVMLHGPRQSGKSTLAQQIAKQHFAGNYITLDDPLLLAEARANPKGFLLARRLPVVIDEVQRAPELFLAIKLLVDRERRPGQFLLTGSANVLVLPKVADSLAGRMEPIELLPLSQAEIEGSPGGFIDHTLSSEPFPSWDGTNDLAKRIARGGFPEPFERSSDARREAWFQSYVRTVLDRDVRDLANVTGLTQMPRLLSLLAARSGSPLNVASLSVDTGVPHTTLTRYVDLFKALFLLQLVPAWSANAEARLARSPKAYLVDTGLLCYLTGLDAKGLATDTFRFEAAAKTLVATELLKLSHTSATKPRLHHLRTVKQKEVDFVLEARDGRIVGIDVITERAVSSQQLHGLRFLEELAGPAFHRGIALYDGDETIQLDQNMIALPIRALWRAG